jgi:hypothetical protein
LKLNVGKGFEMAEVILFHNLKQKQLEKSAFDRWATYYSEQPYEEILQALIYEHENDFPLRRSGEWMDRTRHEALVKVLDDRAQTRFLKTFLEEIR